MILVNFAHPLTKEQIEQLKAKFNIEPSRVLEVKTQLDLQAPLTPQVVELVDRVGLSSAEWQGNPVIINPPGLAPAAVILLAELHGRMGHFPAMLRLAPADIGRYDVAEILDLQAVRDAARLRR